MKFFYRKFLTAFVLLLFALNAKAVNDTLTIGQAFDWKVGDSLVYRPYRWCYINPTFWYYTFVSFKVTDCQIHSDSLVYSILYSSGNYDTIVFPHKDSTVESFNSPLNFVGGCQFGDSLPNYQITEYYYTDSLYPEADCFYHGVDGGEVGWLLKLSKTVGIIHLEIGAKEFCGPGVGAENQGGCGVDLVYYKSDSMTWIDSARYFFNSISEPKTSPSFHLFPNPATDELTITTEAEGVYSISVYDVMGNCVSAPKNFSTNLFHIKVNHLPAGYYYLKLTDEHSNSITKSLVIAR